MSKWYVYDKKRRCLIGDGHVNQTGAACQLLEMLRDNPNIKLHDFDLLQLTRHGVAKIKELEK
jgi:hypothetical protein